MTDQIEEFRQELARHYKEDEARFKLGNERFDQLFAYHKETSAKIDKLITNTDPIVKFLNDAQATGRMADRAQSMALWVLKWGAIWTGCVAGFLAIKKFFFG